MHGIFDSWQKSSSHKDTETQNSTKEMEVFCVF